MFSSTTTGNSATKWIILHITQNKRPPIYLYWTTIITENLYANKPLFLQIHLLPISIKVTAIVMAEMKQSITFWEELECETVALY